MLLLLQNSVLKLSLCSAQRQPHSNAHKVHASGDAKHCGKGSGGFHQHAHPPRPEDACSRPKRVAQPKQLPCLRWCHVRHVGHKPRLSCVWCPHITPYMLAMHTEGCDAQCGCQAPHRQRRRQGLRGEHHQRKRRTQKRSGLHALANRGHRNAPLRRSTHGQRSATACSAHLDQCIGEDARDRGADGHDHPRQQRQEARRLEVQPERLPCDV